MASDELRGLLDELVKRRADTNRRFIDEVLKKVQDRNRRYFLEKLGNELQQMQLEKMTGNAAALMHHQVLTDAYKSILDRCFC
ncbi:MAG TPA: hypothetical protein VHL10_04310 [Nitrososphaera sp.]|jgi:polyhydroxyalkanoate synthesis regulator phasin|nr:hypothetical protein [Nitrososphaera sp.]